VSQPLSIEVEGHQCSAVFSAVGNTTLPFLQTVSSVWYLIHRTALCGMYNLTRREGLFKGRRPPQIHHITTSSPDHPHSSFTQNTSIHPIFFFSTTTITCCRTEGKDEISIYVNIFGFLFGVRRASERRCQRASRGNKSSQSHSSQIDRSERSLLFVSSILTRVIDSAAQS
jgi:hypothetical protein